ncbi:atp synthase subunit s-like protein [Dinothrombium tinctorium]|uniref:Atp synthase subunit s-like protein n=1 Tax=Dinothrombium tinctorium TaxID=1965070 RepID=A0A3S3PQQ9_9ACAR|nr:atp synthase subunit s-like protein [Dinothrombium tinctorium]RWS06362.1 atp synthase subunit s-like protein [Dinothrombium tinctorium]
MNKKHHEKSLSQKLTEILKAEKPISVNYYNALSKRYDFSPGGIRRWFTRKEYSYRRQSQLFIPERHGILGPDLAVAHFLLHRKGKVKFKGDPEWHTDYKKLPIKFEKDYHVSAIDAQNTGLLYEGVDNLTNLKHLEELNVAHNKDLDDWFCDKISRLFRHSQALRKLDLTGCKRISENGIIALFFIPSLREIIISGTKAAEYDQLELLTILFNDVNPECSIIT